MIPQLFRRGHTRWTSLASAYLDNELSPRDLARFERHLETCERCQEVVARTHDARELMATLPTLRAPRSFQLTPAMAASSVPAPAPRMSHPVALRLAQGLTAVAVVAFATVLTIDLTGTGSSSSDQPMAASSEASTHSVSAPDNREIASPTPGPSLDHATPPPPSPTSASTAPAIVPPVVTGVGAQGFAPQNPTPTATVAETPHKLPSVAPSPSTENTFGAHDDAAGGEAKRTESSAGVDHASTYSKSSSTAGWYRPAEIGLAVMAILGAVATAVLALRRRQR